MSTFVWVKKSHAKALRRKERILEEDYFTTRFAGDIESTEF
jgi:hypothetical protein